MIFLGSYLNVLCKSNKLDIGMTLFEVYKFVNSNQRNMLTNSYDTVEKTHHKTVVTVEPFTFSISCHLWIFHSSCILISHTFRLPSLLSLSLSSSKFVELIFICDRG